MSPYWFFILEFSSKHVERTLSDNLVLTFDYNTWKYLTYSLVSTGKGRNAVLSEMQQERKGFQQAGRPPDRPKPGSRPEQL